MPKNLVLTEKPEFVLSIVSDANGPVSVSCLIQHNGGGEQYGVDPVAASVSAVSVLSGQGITLTAAQVRTVWKQLLAQSLTQAKTAGGWT